MKLSPCIFCPQAPCLLTHPLDGKNAKYTLIHNLNFKAWIFLGVIDQHSFYIFILFDSLYLELINAKLNVSSHLSSPARDRT